MKQFILAIVALCFACEAPREFRHDMPSPYTPNPANNPSFITLPDPGDPVASAVVDQAFKDVADKDARKVEGAVAGQTGHVAGTVAVDSGGIITWSAGSLLSMAPGVVESHLNTPVFSGMEVQSGTVLVDNTSSITNNGSLTQNGTVNVGANAVTNFNAPVNLIGYSHIRRAPEILPAASNVLRNASDASTFLYTTLTTNVQIQLVADASSPGALAAVTGDEVFVSLFPLGTNANTVTVKDAGGSTIATLSNNGSGTHPSARFMYFGGNWKLIDETTIP